MRLDQQLCPTVCNLELRWLTANTSDLSASLRSTVSRCVLLNSASTRPVTHRASHSSIKARAGLPLSAANGLRSGSSLPCNVSRHLIDSPAATRASVHRPRSSISARTRNATMARSICQKVCSSSSLARPAPASFIRSGRCVAELPRLCGQVSALI